MHRKPILALAGLVLWSGCAGLPSATTDEARRADAAAEAAADTTDLAARLADFAARPAAARATARARAEAAAAGWRDFEREAREEFDSRYRHWYYRDNPVSRDHRGAGLANAIVDLRRAVAIDPSFAEAWGALGRLVMEAGDPAGARRHLDNARLAAGVEAEAGRPVPAEVRLRILRDRAWALRDLAAWDEGLAAVAEGLAFRPGDPELLLIEGLLLADAGRYSEAVAAAVRMPALRYPRYDFIYRGFKRQTSAFANNWIRAQALLARGDVAGAYRILGDLDLYAYRGLLPFAPRYWRDAALIAELHGDPKAPLYYAVGYVTRPYQHFLPASAHNVAPLVLDVPDPRVPAYLGFGMRTYVAGSPLAYVGTQINRMALAADETERLQARGRALRMLDVLERRHVRPEVCRALRGRILFAGGDLEPAGAELAAARDAFAAAGRVDGGTSLLLGLVHMHGDRWPEAESALGEAVSVLPGSALAWRSLGVARSMNGHLEQADAAMGRALDLDPQAVAGWYNRGLLNLQRQRYAAAVADLDRGLRLDPENREVQRLLQLAAAGHRAEGGDVTAVRHGPPPGHGAAPDTLLARMQAGLDVALAAPDSLLMDAPGADGRFRRLEAAYLEDPRPGRREILARAYLERNLLDSIQALLGPGWGVDLSPVEEVMLLWADRVLGETSRAEQAVREVLARGTGRGNPWALALAAETMRTSVDPVGTDPTTPTNHGYFGWWRDARMSYAGDPRSGRARVIGYAADLFTRYHADPLFEQAQWGLPATPLATSNFGLGRGAGK